MKIIIAGGSGQIGRILSTHFHKQGHRVVVLSRRAANEAWQTAVWDGKTLGDWCVCLEDADVLINLAGRSVNCRYNAKNRHAILTSRTQSTHILGKAVTQCKKPPRLWLQASTATIYAHTYGPPHDEYTGKIGGYQPSEANPWQFSVEVAKAWEREFHNSLTPQTRKILMRSALVMDPYPNGIFDTILGLVKVGLGGRNGSGKQFVSWIHYEDFVRAVEWLIANETLNGVINLAAPNPLPNQQFMRAFRHAWFQSERAFGLPATEWMLEIGAYFLRTESELLLKSRRVVSKKLPESGFRFLYKDWPAAVANLCEQSREKGVV